MNSRIIHIILCLTLCGIACASFKDPRKNVKLKPESTQAEVNKQLGNQQRQGEIGIVERKTEDIQPIDERGSSDARNALTAANKVVDDTQPDKAQNVLKGAEADLEQKQAAPANTAMSFIWWLLGAAALVGAFIYGLNKYAPGPGEKKLEPVAPRPKSVKF